MEIHGTNQPYKGIRYSEVLRTVHPVDYCAHYISDMDIYSIFNPDLLHIWRFTGYLIGNSILYMDMTNLGFCVYRLLYSAYVST